MSAEAAAKLASWRQDPVIFVRDNFGVEPDLWQNDVLRAFPLHNRIAMKACKGPGKTCVLAWLIWNFLCTRPYPKVACTSITGDNLADGLWTELAMWQNKSAFLKGAFEWTKTRIVSKDHSETWWASARQWPKGANSSQQADTLAGLHADNLLFVIDEAGGVPDAVAAAAEAGLATGVDTKLVIAGNPTQLEGPLYRACTSERQLWHLTEITSDPDDPKRTPRVSIKWAREQIEKYGRDNPWVLVNVFGKFPPASLNTLLGPDDISAAQARKYDPPAYYHQARVLGVDVARFGDDRTVIFPRQGMWSGTPLVLRGQRTEQIAAHVARQADSFGPEGAEAIFVDGTGGYGAGVIDALRLGGYSVHEINASGKANDPRYFNKRAECWFLMAEWLKLHGSLFADNEIVRELTAPTYLFHSGKMQLESKDFIKQRLGFSPDLADALALTFATPLAPRNRDDFMVGALAQHMRSPSALQDYDPMKEMR